MSQNPPLLSAHELEKSFGGKPLFSGITMAVSEGERLCLIGPNGSGKSTLLRLMAGIDEPDGGIIRRRSGLRCAYVAQEDGFPEGLTVSGVLEKALIETGHDPHDLQGPVEIICGKTGFNDKNAPVASLSGGWKKRLSLARGLIVQPEILLLDEPTNHLDIAGVLWLENILEKIPLTLIFVSHDRYFIERLAGRVIEINRQYPKGFFAASGGYADFLEARGLFLEGLHETRASLANRVRREVEWLRQGAKARTTKSKYRTEQAGKLMDQLKGFNLEERAVNLEFSASNRKTRDLIRIEGLCKSAGGKTLFKDVTFTLSPGIRLGVVGPNGSGKTTFINILLEKQEQDAGRVVRANNLKIAFFDQSRAQLDLSLSLKESLWKDGDSVVFEGRQIHIAGWAERFLFRRDQLPLPLSSLSGGERARVLLARLMLEESDILIFDEPTNDLDIRTLEVLEDSFNSYPGAVVLITHDRYLLDRSTNAVLGLGHSLGKIFGDYSQWEAAEAAAEPRERQADIRDDASSTRQTEKPKTKLSYNEKRELESIEKEILKAEALVEKYQAQISSEETASDPAAMKEACEKLSEQQQIVESLYNRWEELEEMKKQIKSRRDGV